MYSKVDPLRAFRKKDEVRDPHFTCGMVHFRSPGRGLCLLGQFGIKTDWQKPPNIVFPGAKENKKYMILMLDPDAPNHPEGVFYFHWAVANIPGKNLKTGGDLSKGTTLLSYAGPTPPKGTGQHRYVFLVYEQDNPQGIMEKPEKRAHFDLGRWINPLAKRHPLTGPVAGSQFRVPAE
ncbi:hypothetical protein GE061_016197 [Apolygus lucorum]|uniref:Phosphatidylethanolamine-binding protein n=1 Tax=Apolygus lucorum TaxID=248454 RepID=A0A8S9XGN4_APOLU|nr:hypothetical protein GE061_016197 [Apolygus lucorum]